MSIELQIYGLVIVIVKRKFIFSNIYTNEQDANHRRQAPAGTIFLKNV